MGRQIKGANLRQDLLAINIASLEDHEWRALVRKHSSFFSGSKIRKKFSSIDKLNASVRSPSFIRKPRMATTSLDFGCFFDSGSKREKRPATVDMCAILKTKRETELGMMKVIEAWPFFELILRKLGVQFQAVERYSESYGGLQYSPNYADGIHVNHFRILGSFEEYRSIETEVLKHIFAAWILEPVDLEREALRAESTKAGDKKADAEGKSTVRL